MSVNLHLQNMPRSATNLDVRNFFSGLHIPEGGVQIVGGPDGDAFIAFSSQNDLLQAIMRDGQPLNGQSVKLKLASRGNMEDVINKRKIELAEAKRARALKVAQEQYNEELKQGQDPRFMGQDYVHGQFSGYSKNYEQYYEGQNEQYPYEGQGQYFPSGTQGYFSANAADHVQPSSYVQSDFDIQEVSVPEESFPPEVGLMYEDQTRTQARGPGRKRQHTEPDNSDELPHQAYLPTAMEYNKSGRSKSGSDMERVDRVLRDSMNNHSKRKDGMDSHRRQRDSMDSHQHQRDNMDGHQQQRDSMDSHSRHRDKMDSRNRHRDRMEGHNRQRDQRDIHHHQRDSMESHHRQRDIMDTRNRPRNRMDSNHEQRDSMDSRDRHRDSMDTHSRHRNSMDRHSRHSMDSQSAQQVGLSKDELGEIDLLISPDLEKEEKGDLRQFLGLIKRKSSKIASEPPWAKPPEMEIPPWEKGLRPSNSFEVPDYEDVSLPSTSDEPKEDLVVSINQYGGDRVVQNVFDMEINPGNSWEPLPIDGRTELGLLPRFDLPEREMPEVFDQSIEDGRSKEWDKRDSSRRDGTASREREPRGTRRRGSSQEHGSRKERPRERRSRSRSSELRSRAGADFPEEKQFSSDQPRSTSMDRRSRSSERKKRSLEMESRSSHRSPSPRSIRSRQDLKRNRSTAPVDKKSMPPAPAYHKPTRYAMVNNVAVTVTARDLREFFRLCAIPEGGVILRSGKDDLDALVAHIKFVRDEDTEEALLLNGKMLHGRQVTIKPTTADDFINNKPEPRKRIPSYSRSRSRSRSFSSSSMTSRSRSRSRSRTRTRSKSRSRSSRRSRRTRSGSRSPNHAHGSYPPYPVDQGYNLAQRGYPPNTGPFAPPPPPAPYGMWRYPMGQYPSQMPYPMPPGAHPPFFPPPVHSYPPYPPQSPIDQPPPQGHRETNKTKKAKSAQRPSMNIDIPIQLKETQKGEWQPTKKVEKPNNNPEEVSSNDMTGKRNSRENVKKLKYLRMTNLPPAINAWELRRFYSEDVPLNGVTLVRRSTGTAWFAYVEFLDMKVLQDIFEADKIKDKGQQRDMQICSEYSLQLELHKKIDPGCQVLRSKGAEEDEVIKCQRTSSSNRRSRTNNKGHKSDRKVKNSDNEPHIDSDSSGFSDSLDEKEEEAIISSPEKAPLAGIVVCAENFPLTISEEEAEKFFARCKPIRDSTRKTWDSSGNVIIHVRFATLVMAEYAVVTMNKKDYQGKPILVSFLKKKSGKISET